jgi:hypothetical protein
VGLPPAVLLVLLRFEPPASGLDLREDPARAAWLGALGLLTAGALWSLREGVSACTSFVEMDGRGVRWKGQGGRGEALWGEVSRLASWGSGRHPALALELKNGGRPLLPFVSRPLYRALRERLNPLPAAEEARMGLG